MGFGMTTVLLNLHNAGLYELGAGILAMGIFFGGMAQVVAGCMEFKKGNTFGTTAFTSYSFFWMTLVFLLYFNGKCGFTANSEAFMSAYFFMWGLFTFFMFIGTLKSTRSSQVIFLSLAVLFWMLSARDGLGWKGAWATATGIEGVFCGLSAIYGAMAQVLNENYGKTVLPLG